MNQHCKKTMRLASAFVVPMLAASLSSAQVASPLPSATPAPSGLLDLADRPLFVESSVQPNILFVMDDSGSMDWESTMNIGTNRPGDVWYAELDHTPNNEDETLALCPGFNTMAYDPSRVYTPWQGYNTSGVSYASISGGLQGVSGSNNTPMEDPWNGPVSGNLADLRNHVYYLWNDADNDGAYDEGECSKSRPYKDGSYSLDRCAEMTSCVPVRDLSASERENYANWFTYYRKRAFVAQRAISELVHSSNARMGLGTLHNNDGVGTPVKDMTSSTHKRSLLDNVSKIRPSGGTPLRTALSRAGNYFETGNGYIFNGSNNNIGSPILPLDEGGACQQNFAVVFSDGYMNSGYSGINVGNADADNNTAFDGGRYGDTLSNRLADIAMHFYERDISPLPNEVRETELENNGDAIDGNMHQHLVTYTVAFGVAGTLSCNPLLTSCSESWPTSIPDDDRRSIDDMWHAAVNGRGQFLSAFNPTGLIESLDTAISDIEARTSSSASLAANSTTLNAETVIYQATFNTGDWHGNLSAIPVSIGATDPRAVCAGVREGNVCFGTPDAPGALWETKTRINNQNFDTGRVVVSYKPMTGGAVAFRWPEDFTDPQSDEIDNIMTMALLEHGPAGEAAQAVFGRNLVNWLRGDRSKEVAANGSSPTAESVFRRRENSVLGDIVTSAPKLVGAPRGNHDDAAYQTFKTTYANRDTMIYVGANDGMLHAINAETGDVAYSYVPASSLRHLADLAQPNYNHRYFVDGSPTVGDVFINGQWRTILLGSHRAGGQNIFALDITDPSKFTEDQDDIDDVFLWEFERDELGYTFSQPDMVKLADGKWYAIFGNGYNATEDDGDPATTGNARLYIVDLANGSSRELVVVDSTDTVGNPNGLSTATPVDEDRDGDTDFVYAGDLKGNLWRFDLQDASAAGWTSTKVFTTRSPEGNRQPITTRPTVAFHPQSGKTGFLVYFGTGRYLTKTDGESDGQDTQTFYAVWDDPLNPVASLQVPPAFNRISGYLQQSIDSEVTLFGQQLRITSDHAIDWNIHRGWFMDMVNTQGGNTSNGGERIVNRATLRGSRIVFVTTIPDEIACNFGGKSVLMELSAADGGRLDDAPLDINNDGIIDANDLIPSGNPLVPPIVPSGMVLDGINTPPIFLNGARSGTELKMMSSSAQTVNSVLESQDNANNRRSSWREVNFN